jgi:TRAP-type transport system periplasmic protein
MEEAMKRITIVLGMLVVLLSFSLYAAGQGEAEGSDQTVERSYSIKMGHGHSTSHPNHIGYLAFKEMVEGESDGRITVEIYPSNQLGNEEEMLQQLKVGTLQFTISGRFNVTAPKLEAFGLPFLFRDYTHVEQVLGGPIGEEYAKAAEKNGVKILGYTHSGLRQITNNVRPIKSPADLKGLKMRTPPIESILQTMKAMGANPTPIPFGELYMALRNGVVDGQENPFINIYTAKFYEVQKYMLVCNYIYITSPFWVDLKWYNKLSDSDRDLIDRASDHAINLMNQITADGETEMRQKLAEAGMDIYELSPSESAAFQDKVQPVYDWAIDAGYITEEIIEKIKQTGL